MNEQPMAHKLAWYVNGTLSASERAEMEQWLADNPEAQLQLAEYEFMRDSIAEEGADEPQFDTEAGLARLMARIEREEAANEATPAAAPTRWWEALAARLQWGLTPAFARVAMVSQLGVVMVLGALLLLPAPAQDPAYQVLSGAPPPAVDGLVVTIGLAPDTSLAQLQRLLRAQQAEIVGGPSALGTYRVRLPDDADQARRLAALKGDPAVIYLDVAAGAPTP